MSGRHHASRRRRWLVWVVVTALAAAAVTWATVATVETNTAKSPLPVAPPAATTPAGCEFAGTPTVADIANRCGTLAPCLTARATSLRVGGRSVEVGKGFGLYVARAGEVAYAVTPSERVVSVPNPDGALGCLAGAEFDVPPPMRPASLCHDLFGETEDRDGIHVGRIDADQHDDPHVMVLDADYDAAAGLPVLVVQHLEGGVYVAGELREVPLRVTPQAYWAVLC